MTGIVAQNVGRASGLIKSAGGGGGGVWTKIKEITASADSTIDFVDGTSDVVLDSTYPIYVFKFYNIHPETDDQHFTFQANASGGSGFNETITSTHFRAYHFEDGSNQGLAYRTANDQAQGTSYQRLSEEIGNGNDESLSGYLHLFNPSSSVFVTHFIARTSLNIGSPRDTFVAGYINTTSAIDEISFAFTSGDIDTGTFKLYGIKDS